MTIPKLGFIVRLASASVLGLALHLSSAAAETLKPRPELPRIKLSVSGSSGQTAVDLLGGNLDGVAAHYGKTGQQLRRELLRDKRLRLDRGGRLYAVEELEKVLTPSDAPRLQTLGLQDGLLAPLTETFRLHSKPGAQKVIVLNFQGARLTGTAWNGDKPIIQAAPYDIDSNPAQFSDEERRRIQYIWQRVSEDFSPLDINVTTELQTPARLANNGTQVIITRNSQIFSCRCGGVAYISTFGNTYYPAFVFTESLGNGNEKFVAEAASHEAGHTLSLLHDSTAAGAYYAGHGSGATGWAPIMGAGYYKPVTQFSKGEYNGATNLEDDFERMRRFVPLRADTAGDTPGEAATFPATANGGTKSGSIEGILERQGDRDLYGLVAGTGTLTAAATPAARAANTDLVLSVLDDQGTVLATANPAAALNATLTYQVTVPGTYYIQVSGAGFGDPRTDGYSNYGSVGVYKLTASYAGGNNMPPVAQFSIAPATGTAPLSVTLDATASSDPDGQIQFSYWDFGDGTSNNTGSATTVQKTFNNIGTYPVSLRIVDNAGTSTTINKTVTVLAPARSLVVKSVRIDLLPSGRTTAANALVTVVDEQGKPLRDAKISATWSKLVSGTATGKTSARGDATLRSTPTASRGCFQLTINNVQLTGYRLPRETVAEKCM